MANFIPFSLCVCVCPLKRKTLRVKYFFFFSRMHLKLLSVYLIKDFLLKMFFRECDTFILPLFDIFVHKFKKQLKTIKINTSNYWKFRAEKHTLFHFMFYSMEDEHCFETLKFHIMIYISSIVSHKLFSWGCYSKYYARISCYSPYSSKGIWNVL